MHFLVRRPCPFCGDIAEAELSPDLLFIRATCKGCGVHTAYKSMWWLASDAWNAGDFDCEMSQLSIFDDLERS